MHRPLTRLLFRSLTCAAMAAALVPAAASAAAPKKGSAPVLKLEQRLCTTGPAATDRSLTVTAVSLLPGGKHRVAMRFRAQHRTTRGKWTPVVTSASSSLGRWETSTTDGSALRITKQLNSLWEDVHYRVVIQARGVDRSGKVLTQTSQRIVTCVQPQVTPDVRITKVKRRGNKDDVVAQVTLRNAGASTSGTSQITVTPVPEADATGDTDTAGASANTRRKRTPVTKPLLVATTAPLRSRASRTVSLSLGACSGPVRITVEPRAGADGEPAGPANTAVFNCTTGKSAAKPKRR